MPFQEQFAALKTLDTADLDVSLAIVKEYKVNRESRYTVEYVQTTETLRERLGHIVRDKLAEVAIVREYNFDIPEPEPDEVLAINIAETDFLRIKESLHGLLPGENLVANINELVKAKAYMIIFRNAQGVQLVGFKTLPESWKLKRQRGLISLMWRENRFEDLGNENVFSISGTVDFISFEDALFVSSKKQFEAGMNYRDAMLARAEELYRDVHQLRLFRDLDLLTARVGNNQRYLRKIAIVQNLRYYRDVVFLQRMRELNEQENWGVQFEGEQIVLTAQTIDDVLTLLQDKRLRSPITERLFDVDSARPYQRVQ